MVNLFHEDDDQAVTSTQDASAFVEAMKTRRINSTADNDFE